MATRLKDIPKTIKILVFFFILLATLYIEPWKILTNSGTMYILMCEQQYESNSVWEYHKKDGLINGEKKCSTSNLRTIKLKYKAFVEKQKVVFSGKEIGVVSYDCDVFDRNNFTCPNKNISVESGKALLSFASYERAVPKWRYVFTKISLFMDQQLQRETVYSLI